LIFWWWTLTATAASGEDRWWRGLPVADVVLEASEGGLPDQNFEDLLRTGDGRPLEPGDIRLDLATLFQVGEFSGVEARVEPFVVYDESGAETPGVLLTYVLTPAPKIARVKIVGGEPLSRLEIEDALGIHPGQVFFPEVDGPAIEARLETWLLRQGWLGPDVRIRTSEPVPGQLYVAVEVDPGRPNTLDALSFVGAIDGVVTPETLTRWARHAGLKEGRPVTPDAVGRAQDEILARLGDVGGSTLLLRPRRGWIGARVTPAIVPGPFESPDGTVRDGIRITFAVEPGEELQLEVEGLGFQGRRKALTALGIDHRLRITRGWLDDAPGRLVEFLQDRGYYAATATVTHDTALRVDAQRGGYHEFGPAIDLQYVDLDVTWGDGAAESRRDRRRDESALQAVFDQSSPDVLRRDVYTDRAMAVGAEAARQFLVDRGQLDAVVEVGPPTIRDRRTIANVLRWGAGRPLRRRITPHVTAAPGPTTLLRGLELVGAAPGVDTTFFTEARDQAVGGPYSPQDLEALSRRLVESHRTLGYAEASATVTAAEDGPLGRRAAITVDAGEQVLLRSVLIRGAIRTRDAFLHDQIDAPLGAPVTTGSLEAIRGNLYDLGIFRTVSTELLGDEAVRDLLVTVDELATWVFEGGAGLSTDQGVRLFGRATRTNLFGLAHRAELFGQLGLDYRSEDIRDWTPDILNPEWRAALSYTAPRFPLSSQEVVADLVLRERVQERTWRMDRTGVGLALQTRFDRAHTEVRLGGRIEDRQLNQVDTAALLEGEPWDLLLGEEPVLPSPWRWQETLTSLLVLDLRDDPITPHRGGLLSVNGEVAPGIPWPNQPRTAFLKAEARAALYLPVGPITLQLSGRGGHARSTTDGLVPLEDRFRLGGTGSLRGFVRDGVGPQNNAPRVSVEWPEGIGPVIDQALRNEPDRWTPTGGDTLAQGTAELFIPLPALGLSGWEGYATQLFWDVGNAWLVDPNAIATTASRPALPSLRHGVGLGLQSATPIGPLQIDFALNPQSAFSNGAVRELLVTELEEPSWRVHLTLGATF
jgi:outer membrane protein assembly factor BamA